MTGRNQMLQVIFQDKGRIRSRRRGAAIVEMAFVVVILLALTLGLIQWGLIYNASISVTNLSREAARFAAVHPDSDAEIVSYVKNNAPPGIRAEDLTISISPPEGNRPPYTAIHVVVEYDMARKLFLPSKMYFPFTSEPAKPSITFFSGTYRADGHMMIEG